MNTSLCPTCGGPGYQNGPIHYVGLGDSALSYCKKCDLGQQLFRQWSRRAPQQAHARRIKKEKVMRARELSCMGAQFSGQRLADLIDQPGLCLACNRYIQRWEAMKKTGRGLYFSGGVGSGKTYAACVVVNELIERYLVEALYVNFPEAAHRFELALGDQDNSDGFTLLDRMKRVELLVLDDLGLEKHSAWLTNLLYQVVDDRWSSKRSVIVVSHLSFAQFARRYTPELASRIEASCQVTTVSGRDRRKLR